MKVTIIPADGAVYKDGVSYSNLALVDAPENVHALQWDGTKGWIEFSATDDDGKAPNEAIVELPEWVVSALAAWEVAAQEELEATARMRELEQLAQQTRTPVEVVG